MMLMIKFLQCRRLWTFGALNGNIFADELNFEAEWLEEARRYLTNIVGKYGAQVQSALKKAAALDIEMICPLHGPVWRENLAGLLINIRNGAPTHRRIMRFLLCMLLFTEIQRAQ